MDAQKVIDWFGEKANEKTMSGKQAATARALGATRPGVRGWLTRGIPAPRQAQIELASYGRFRCEDRPWETDQ